MKTLPSRTTKSAKQDIAVEQARQELRLARFAHPALIETYARIPRSERLEKKQLSVHNYGNEYSFYITLHGVRSLKKDKRLARVLTAFIDDNYKTKTDMYAGSPPQCTYTMTREIVANDSTQSYYTKKLEAACALLRKNWYSRDVDSFKISVVVTACVAADSPTCRTVVKGVKETVYREEIKEVVCD